MDKLEEYYNTYSDLIVAYCGRLLLAIIVLVVGLWVIRRIVNVFSRSMEKREVELSLRPFLRSIVGALLRVLLIISVLSMVGVAMTSFIAVLGAAGLAIGLALQGSLSNFAGGVLILLLKPFKVGDFIDNGTYSGTVREIQIFYTYITTGQNQEVIIPNGNLSNNAVKNYSFHNTRRMDIIVQIGYNEDIEKVKNILNRIIESDSRILKVPAHDVFVEALTISMVNVHFRIWARSSDYWAIAGEVHETIKKAFDREGIAFPTPQQNIQIIK